MSLREGLQALVPECSSGGVAAWNAWLVGPEQPVMYSHMPEALEQQTLGSPDPTSSHLSCGHRACKSPILSILYNEQFSQPLVVRWLTLIFPLCQAGGGHRHLCEAVGGPPSLMYLKVSLYWSP